MLTRRKSSQSEPDGARPATHGSTAHGAPASGAPAQDGAGAAPARGSRLRLRRAGRPAPAAPAVAVVETPRPDRSQGKSGPTPRRRDQEAARRRPLVPEDRKEAKKAQRDAAAAERMRQRVALETGDDRHLPARDKGPQRRWVRDLVDARTSVGEWLMPIVFLYVLLMFVPGAQFQLILMISLYVLVALVIVDSVLLSRRIKKGLTARFGAPESGTGLYGVMRALQFRRLRLPKPQVKRGQYPA